MYKIKKRMEISAAHFLRLDYKSKCSSLHGHNWIVLVSCKSNKLNKNGMVVDFTKIKEQIHDVLDHRCFNDVLPDMSPTAENIAKWICGRIPECYKVKIQESEGNIATYEDLYHNYEEI